MGTWGAVWSVVGTMILSVVPTAEGSTSGETQNNELNEGFDVSGSPTWTGRFTEQDGLLSAAPRHYLLESTLYRALRCRQRVDSMNGHVAGTIIDPDRKYRPTPLQRTAGNIGTAAF